MKRWESPVIVELNINETAMDPVLSVHWDGGYTGDGTFGLTTEDSSKCQDTNWLHRLLCSHEAPQDKLS